MKKQIHIFLLRGLTRESAHWGSFTDSLQSGLPNAQIHLMDLPGAGRHIHQNASIRAAKMVDFMRDEVLNELNQKNRINIICATSLAGMLACDWTIRYKKDFHGLIIISASFKNICSSRERVSWAVKWEMVRILFTRNIWKRENLIIKVNSNRPQLIEPLTDDWTAIQKERKMTRLNIFKQSISGLLIGLKDEKPDLPILIIGSEGDRMVCPECIKKSHDFLGGTLIFHADSGHGIPIDEPIWLSRQISDWTKIQYSK